MCPWLEMAPNEIPLLELPSTSADLALPSSILMKTLEVLVLILRFFLRLSEVVLHYAYRCTNYADRFIVRYTSLPFFWKIFVLHSRRQKTAFF